MTDLAAHVQDYLRLRRSLGFKLEQPGEDLPRFVAYLEASGAETITAELAISWARLPEGVQLVHWAHRLGAVRGFATYLKTIDPATEVPPHDVFGARQQRPVPYLWSDADIGRLMDGARRLRPAIWAATCETLFGLLAASGMRIGEAVGLERSDVDLATGVVTIRDGKFGRTRIVPLHESTTAALASYAARRDALSPGSRAFFVPTTATALGTGSVQVAFKRITTQIGLRSESVRPRLHDLRHTFAVRTLVEWLRAGVDVSVGMPALATYLGHVNYVGTYWYLQASPELMALAAARLGSRFGGGR
jgi:integrase/recombinase XerD